MLNSKVPWKNSVFMRLLLTFIIVLVPLFLIGYNIYNWGFRSISYEIVNSMQAQTDFYTKNLENEIQRIKLQQYGIMNDENLNALLIARKVDSYNRTLELNSVQQRVEAIKSSSRYIQEARIYIPGIRKTITSTSILDMEEKDLERLKVLSVQPDGKVNSWKEDLFLNVKSPIMGNFEAKLPDFCLEVTLSKMEIENTLKELLTYDGSGSFLYRKNSDLMLPAVPGEALPTGIRDGMPSGKSMIHNGKPILVFHSTLLQDDLTMMRYVPEDRVMKKIDQFRLLFWGFTITAFIIIIIFTISTHRFIYRPFTRLAGAFEHLDRGDMNFKLKHDHNDEFKNIYERFNTMVANLNKLIDQVYKQKIHAQRAELKQLQSQINPHFLYNSFFILNSMSRTGDYDNLERFTAQLGEYFQFVTRNTADEVTLEREANHARLYSDIQAFRFSNRIQVSFGSLPEGSGKLPVPRLIIQPLIENAFRHGLEKKLENGLLDITFRRLPEALVISIGDNGGELTEEELAGLNNVLEQEDEVRETTGIINIHKRLKIRFGPESGLSFARSEIGGLKATILIKLQEAENV